MLDTNYSVDILINDKPVRKFPFDGKLFVEARPGTEYSIRIKNNTQQRILAVTSVDGLDVLTGKSAKENGSGYVINGYSSLNLDGFRVSDAKVAKFVFDHKGESYASSKQDGSEKNVGVIGVRVFNEKLIPQVKEIIREEHHHHHHFPKYPVYPKTPYDPYNPFRPTITWYDNTITSDTYGNSTLSFAGNDAIAANTLNLTNINCSNNNFEKHCGEVKRGSTRGIISNNNVLRSMNCSTTATKLSAGSFDIGTKWGEAKESKVIEVDFEKGCLILTSNIYYASRQSLIDMGVPITNEKQVSFPEPFVDGKYAKPPTGWRG